MTRNTTTRSRARRISTAAFTVVLAAACGIAGGLPAHAATETHSQTFGPGVQETFTVPAEATGVQVTVAGAQGGWFEFGTNLGGPGGMVTVDLGLDFNGETLNLLVGRASGEHSEGSYLATDDEFLVIAGGGGRAGRVAPSNLSLAGGAGGFADGSPNGGDGDQPPGFAHSGLGAIGTTAGVNGYSAGEISPPPSTFSPASVAAGVITPSTGDPSPTSGDRLGGGGLATGGAMAQQEIVTDPTVQIITGAGGGGSGYLAPGLTILSTGANAAGAGVSDPADGYITFTWTVQVDDPGDDPELAETGTDIGAALAVALGAIVVGAVSLVLYRREMGAGRA